jgi:hypothetical protein
VKFTTDGCPLSLDHDPSQPASRAAPQNRFRFGRGYAEAFLEDGGERLLGEAPWLKEARKL